jgi:hypothetical protein
MSTASAHAHVVKGIQQGRLLGPHPVANREWAQDGLACKNPSNTAVRDISTSRPRSHYFWHKQRVQKPRHRFVDPAVQSVGLLNPCLLTRRLSII